MSAGMVVGVLVGGFEVFLYFLLVFSALFGGVLGVPGRRWSETGLLGAGEGHNQSVILALLMGSRLFAFRSLLGE